MSNFQFFNHWNSKDQVIWFRIKKYNAGEVFQYSTLYQIIILNFEFQYIKEII